MCENGKTLDELIMGLEKKAGIKKLDDYHLDFLKYSQEEICNKRAELGRAQSDVMFLEKYLMKYKSGKYKTLQEMIDKVLYYKPNKKKLQQRFILLLGDNATGEKLIQALQKRKEDLRISQVMYNAMEKENMFAKVNFQRAFAEDLMLIRNKQLIEEYEKQEALRVYREAQAQERRAKQQDLLNKLGLQDEKNIDIVFLMRLSEKYTIDELETIAKKAKNNNYIAKQILENYHTANYGRGYYGYSMSNNAKDAYEKGLKPLSKWNSKDAKELAEILGVSIRVKDLKRFLKKYGKRGEHHTSKYFNLTDFYSIAQAFSKGKSALKELLNKEKKKWVT